jgi:hypothetical protein
MPQSFVGVLIRGRIAWIAAIALGMALAIAGGVKHENAMLGAGVGFMAFGLSFLIASIVAQGKTD